MSYSAFMRSYVFIVLRWALAIGLLIYVVRSGHLSLAHVQAFLKHPVYAELGLLLLTLCLFICFFRWQILLRAQGLHLRYFEVLKLGMIGQFFSIVIPGNVSGDLVKALYLAKSYPQKKSKAFTSIFLDRVFGACGMVLLGATAFIFSLKDIMGLDSSLGRFILYLGFAMLLGAITILLGLLIFPFWHKKLPSKTPQFIVQIYENFLVYKNHSRTLWLALGLSFLNHIVIMAFFWTAATSVFGPPPWGTLTPVKFFMACIMGNLAMSIPVAPMGLGVGQVAFSSTFLALGAPSETFGAAIITGSQLTTLVLGLCGSLFFIAYKNKKLQVLPTT